MDMGSNSNDSRGEVVLDRRSLDSITSYEVTDEQLLIIEGASSSNELNYAISLISVFISLIITISTTKIEGETKVAVFWSALFVTGILGTFFALQYWKNRKNSKSIFIKIRSQKSTQAVRDNAAAVSPVTEVAAEQSTSQNENN